MLHVQNGCNMQTQWCARIGQLRVAAPGQPLLFAISGRQSGRQVRYLRAAAPPGSRPANARTNVAKMWSDAMSWPPSSNRPQTIYKDMEHATGSSTMINGQAINAHVKGVTMHGVPSVDRAPERVTKPLTRPTALSTNYLLHRHVQRFQIVRSEVGRTASEQFD
jgi:hypothetical protein